MLKKGDKVRFNQAGMSALGNGEYVPNPCSERLLAGEALEVSGVVPQSGGGGQSLHFFGAAYSFSEDYFELA